MENYIATYFLVTFRAHEIECVIHLGLSLVTNRVVGIYTRCDLDSRCLRGLLLVRVVAIILSFKSDSCPYAIVINSDDTRLVIITPWRCISVRAGGFW